MKVENMVEETKEITLITSHFSPDYDALAAMLAAGKIYPEAFLIWPGGPEKNFRNIFLKSLGPLVKTAKISEIKLENVSKLVVVDTRQPSRLSVVAKVLKNPNLSIHLYDHHPDAFGDLKGDFELVEMTGAVVTLLIEIIEEKKIELKPQEATMLALGLYEDTGSLSFSSTTPRDLRAAAFLLEKGANLSTVNDLMIKELNVQQLAVLNELGNSLEYRKVGGVTITIASAEVENYVDDIAILAHKLVDLSGSAILFVLVALENRVQLVARARIDNINVGRIAKEFGGGGHATAAAATIKDLTLHEVKAKLENILVSSLGPVRKAKDIMVYPVISAASYLNISEARDLMIQYGINVLIVTDENEKILGYISQRNISKAIHHDLGSYPIKSFMNSEFKAVNPQSTFNEIQDLLVESHQRILPVVENDKIVGVITRTDILHIMATDLKLPEPPNPLKNGSYRRNLTNLIKHNLPPEIGDLLKTMGETALEINMVAYAVGGFVRDLLRHRTNLDIDVAIEGDALVFGQVFMEKNPGAKIHSHDKFKTATIYLKNGLKVDLSTARLEYYEHPGALPVVKRGSILLDLYRRDFTINALALNLNPAEFGVLIDHYRGVKDLKEGHIKVIHNLSFVEDPTRVFRAIRFESRLGFTISKMTQSLIKNVVENKFFDRIGTYRLKQELKLIFKEEAPQVSVKRLDEFGILKYIHPDLKYDLRMEALFKSLEKIYDWQMLSLKTPNSRFWMLYMAALLNFLPQKEILTLHKKFKYSKIELHILTAGKMKINAIIGEISNKYYNQEPSEKFVKTIEQLSPLLKLMLMAKLEDQSHIRVVGNTLTNFS